MLVFLFKNYNKKNHPALNLLTDNWVERDEIKTGMNISLYTVHVSEKTFKIEWW